MQPDKVAIVGGASSYKEAPFQDESWEIWGCNNLYPLFPRITRWFEIHHILFDRNIFYRRGEREFRGKAVNQYLGELAGLGCPVYMQQAWVGIIPSSVPYPLAQVVKVHGHYFTCTMAYQLALAIEEGFKEIGIWGWHGGFDDEYQNQKPCIEYLLGYAKGRGIKIHIAELSMLLFTPHKYGYDERFSLSFIKAMEMANYLKRGNENV